MPKTIRQVIDETIEKAVLDNLLPLNIPHGKGFRFNELYNRINRNTLIISKTALIKTLNNLIKKGLVERKEMGILNVEYRLKVKE
jgi:DNA-binding HxlR family transcriptional regulator